MLLLIFSLIAAVSAAPEVNLGRTTLVGANFSASKVEFFGGIPFAQPPVGQLRLRPSVLTTVINATKFNATSFGLGCLQKALPAEAVSEDCLTLNIFRPAGVDSRAKLPVMFWLYGVGASSLYNGTGIVARSIERGTPVIFVSANYRLGPLGFPQGIETGLRKAGNLGLGDQIAALKWMQANIDTFGGDKNKVTIVGESAGAISIQIHILGSAIKGLARAAILESLITLPTYGPEHNQGTWQSFVSAVPECANLSKSLNTFDCLRSAKSDSLLEALSTGPLIDEIFKFFTVIDGPGGFLPDVPSKLTPLSPITAMIGTNLDEGTLFIPQTANSTEEIREFLVDTSTPSLRGPKILATTVEQILKLYPDISAIGSPFETGNDTFGLSSQYKRFAAIFGDVYIQSARRAFSQSMSKRGVKNYAYLFTDPDAVIPPGITQGPLAPGSLGVAHTSEIFYVFNTLTNPTPTAIRLSNMMQDYWISFASGLDPNDGRGSERPTWEQYTPQTNVLLDLNGHGTKHVPDNFREVQINLINADPLVFHR